MDLLAAVAEGLKERRLAPYLGQESLTLGGVPPFPVSPVELVGALNHKVAVPGRLRSNLWSAAQWIEANKHRQTLVRALNEIFAPAFAPNRLHLWLAGLGLPLIVDSWYDTAMHDALIASGASFFEWQGIRRSGQTYEEPWGRTYDAAGREVALLPPANGETLLYKPHGAVRPAGNYLVSDSDYVEVLTEIDIQTPIPEEVIARRGDLGFVFFGCRFDDQMQRTFAHQIIKRSNGPHYAIMAGELTRNEARFIDQEGIARLDMPLADAVERLLAV